MKLLSTAEIKKWDEYTIQHEPISSLQLMERAAKSCVSAIIRNHDAETEYMIFCGKGNNGGDGLAITRLLNSSQTKATAVIVHYTPQFSKDAEENFKLLESQFPGVIIHIHNPEDLKQIVVNENSVIIDAIFGIGLNKPVDDLAAEAIQTINRLGKKTYSIDIPSGLYADRSSEKNKYIVHSTKTLTFQCPKLAFMMAENAPYVPDFEILNIGLDNTFQDTVRSPFTFLQKHHIKFLLQPRPKFSYKNMFGHALMIGGSEGKSGAVILAAKACLKSGAGLLTVHSTEKTISAILNQLPEAMTSTDPESMISELPKSINYTVAGVGPGLGTDKQTQAVLKLLIQNATVPIVFDADAINILGENKTWISFIQPECVFTPHVKEFDRLTMAHTSDFDRLETAISFSKKYRQIIVLKGTYTAVISPDGQVYFNSTGNPALAKGGSGDVLTGMITGLISSGYSTLEAATIAVYVHGACADECIRKQSEESVLASDVMEKIGKVLKKLKK